jgi:hypothetical protein
MTARSIGSAALLALAFACGLRAQTRACGVERWPVKIAADAEAGRIDTVPAPMSISALRALPRPPRPLPFNTRIAPYELRTYRVRAVLRQVITESDGDWHLVLADPDASGRTIIGEIPDSACALGSVYAGRFASVRRDLRAAPKNALIEVVGFGFFDYVHGQRGVAPNGFELHPIVDARIIGRAPGERQALLLNAMRSIGSRRVTMMPMVREEGAHCVVPWACHRRSSLCSTPRARAEWSARSKARHKPSRSRPLVRSTTGCPHCA